MDPLLNAPVILISGSRASSKSVQAAATMIAASGAVPLVVTNHLGRVKGKDRDGLYEVATELMKKADGMVILGNDNDIDPSEYGQAKGARTSSELMNKDGSVNEAGMARRNLETLMMRIAAGAGMPMLGICAGMQRMNVLCGGTLHQHLPDQMQSPAHSEHAQQDLGIPPFVPVQPVTFKQDTLLAQIAGQVKAVFTPARTAENEISLDVNSMHHQAVDKVGQGLRVAAQSEDVLKDGTKSIEALEIDPSGPLAAGPMGNRRFGVFVQWHPEFMDSPIGAKISEQLNAASQEFIKLTGRQHTLEEVQAENRLSALEDVKAPGPDTATRPGSIADRILKARAASQSLDVTH